MPDPDLIPNHQMVPTAPLAGGERVLESFPADRATYVRDHAAMAAVAMAGGMIVLWLLGNPYLWTGAVGGLAAIAVRGFYLASEDLSARWDLTDRRLLGPMGRIVPLASIAQIRALGSAVQIVTTGGDKHLIKYQANKDTTRRAIARAAGLPQEGTA